MRNYPKKWRQASLVFFVMMMVLIIPNITRFVG